MSFSAEDRLVEAVRQLVGDYYQSQQDSPETPNIEPDAVADAIEFVMEGFDNIMWAAAQDILIPRVIE